MATIAAERRVVRLAELRAPRKKTLEAGVRRVGIVPEVSPEQVSTGDLISPANNGTADTNVHNHGGTLAPGMTVQLIFWGQAWQNGDQATLADQLTSAAQVLCAGPYFSGLPQYGGAPRPGYGGAIYVTSPDPPATFDDGTIGDLVWNLIDDGHYPEPDDSGGRNWYCVLMPPGTNYGPGGALAAHSHPTDYDFPFDWDTAWAAWVGNYDLDTMTRAFGHELAETITDPEGSGWYVDSSGAEIGDLCNARQGRLNGVWVEGYWSNGARACVIRQNYGTEIGAVSRYDDKLDLFVCGNDGVVYTSWWGDGADWSGVNNDWAPIGGFFPVGAPVASVSRHRDQLDLFVVGNDGRVYTSWWNPQGGWSGARNNWRSIGGFFPVGAPVTAISRHEDQLDLFVVGNDGVVYTSWWTAGADWSGVNDNWRAIGGVFPQGARVAAVSRDQDQLDLFVVGNNGVVFTSWWSEGADWSGLGGWSPIGGVFPPGAPVSAVTRAMDQLDLFLIGYDGVVYTSWWNPQGGWSGLGGWRPIGGFFPMGAQVAALARMRDHLDLFVTGNDGRVYTSWWHAGSDWSGVNNDWAPIGGFFPLGAPVAAVSRFRDQLDLFVVGNDGVVYTEWWTDGSTWSGIDDDWRPIGGIFPVGV